jgi:hypothetical protein
MSLAAPRCYRKASHIHIAADRGMIAFIKALEF